jgi:hypothetical protein
LDTTELKVEEQSPDIKSCHGLHACPPQGLARAGIYTDEHQATQVVAQICCRISQRVFMRAEYFIDEAGCEQFFKLVS